MAIADKKKCQTLINLCALRAQEIATIATELEAYRTAYIAQGVDPAGTALEGNVTLVSDWIDAIRACADSPVTAGLIVAYVPSHRNKALGEL